MISGIDSGAVLASGNLATLKKAIESEEGMMNSLLSGMQGAQNTMQTQAPQNDAPAPAPQSTGKLDIMA